MSSAASYGHSRPLKTTFRRQYVSPRRLGDKHCLCQFASFHGVHCAEAPGLLIDNGVHRQSAFEVNTRLPNRASRRHTSGNATLHVDRASAVELVATDLTSKRIHRPSCRISNGDHIDMA